jgi:hypothetical protein
MDPIYLAHLIEAEEEFWKAVQENRDPKLVPLPEPDLPIDKRAVIDLSGSNEWGDAAARWLESKDAAKIYDKAVADIKGMVPKGVGRVFGGGIEVTVSTSGSKSIKALAPSAQQEKQEA